MKKILIMIILCSAIFACKAKKAAGTSAKENTEQPAPVVGTTTGTVSHMYQATGCSTVIIVKNGDNELTLIPKDKLAKEFDVDGLSISFNYRTLKMPNPEGCSKGIPAEITDISKK